MTIRWFTIFHGRPWASTVNRRYGYSRSPGYRSHASPVTWDSAATGVVARAAEAPSSTVDVITTAVPATSARVVRGAVFITMDLRELLRTLSPTRARTPEAGPSHLPRLDRSAPAYRRSAGSPGGVG